MPLSNIYRANLYQAGASRAKVKQTGNITMKFISTIISTCLLLLSMSSYAETIEDLVVNEQLAVSMQLTNQTDIIPNEPAIYDIEVLSANPFSNNMALTYVDVVNSVVVPPSENTKLDVRSIDGKDWFVQSKKVIIYPLQSGEFSVPEMTVNVSINFENTETVVGLITTEPQKFMVTEEPSGLSDLNYLVSSKLELTLKKQPRKEEKLEVGHAVTQTYTVKGNDLHTLVLPEFNIPEFDGVKVYKKTAKKLDEFERLAKIDQASVIQEVTFIFQQDGYYVIPEQKIVWWNTKTKTVEQAIIEEQTFVVGNGVPSTTDNGGSNSSEAQTQSSLPIMQWLYMLVVTVFVIAVLISLYRHKTALMQSFNRVNNTQRKQISHNYLNNIEQKNYQLAIMNLYQLAEIVPGNINSLADYLNASSSEHKLLLKLQQLAFSTDSQSDVSISIDQAKQILAALIKTNKSSFRGKRFEFSMDLNNEQQSGR